MVPFWRHSCAKKKDQRFLNLIRKALKAGYLNLQGNQQESLIGTPQGSILSPILANAYLNELDEFVEALRLKFDKGTHKSRNHAYQVLSWTKSRLAARGQTKSQEFKQIAKKMRRLPSLQVNDPNFIRLKYLRFADDWIIGVCGSHALAKEIKQQVKDFLNQQLKLTLNEEKTHITNARQEESFFLGTILKLGAGGEAKLTLSTNLWGKKFKRRSTGWQTVMKAPIPKLIQRLSDRGFCTKEGRPISKSGWAFLDVDQLINLYSSINRGIQNYYRFVDNWVQLQRIQYILQFSLAMTLGRKFKISTPKVFKRFGKNLTYVIKNKGPGEVITPDRRVSFYLNHAWTKHRDDFQVHHPNPDLVRTEIRMRTRSKLDKPCCICGQTAEESLIEMHHVRHIRKLSDKKQASGFNHILRKLNRKQIPVCKECHQKIHRGEYDGYKLANLAYSPK
jgi:hypothetical protein